MLPRVPGDRAPSKTRAFRVVLAGLVLPPAFAAALLLGAVLHLELPLTRRVVLGLVASSLDGALAGRVRVGRLERLGPSSLAIADVRISDPEGHPVLSARRVAVEGPGWLGLLAVLGETPRLVVRRLALEDAEVDLELDDAGTLGLARAFTERPGPPGPPLAPPPAPIRVILERIEIDRVRVRGALAPTHTLDTVVTELLASLRFEPASLDLDLTRATVTESKLAPMPVHASIALSLRLPRDAGGAVGPPTEGAAEVDATLGTLQIRLRGRTRAGRHALTLVAPRVEREALVAWFPESPIQPPSPVGMELRLEGDGDGLEAAARVSVPPRSERVFPSGPAKPGTLEVRGRYDNASATLALDVTASELDLATLAPNIGESRIGAQASLRVDAHRRAAHGTIRVGASELAQTHGNVLALPPASGTFDASEGGADARLRIDEPGGPTEALVRIGANRALEFALHTVVPVLGAIPRLESALPQVATLRGSGELTASGRYADGVLDAFATARVRGLAAPREGVSLARAEVDSRVFGALDALRIDARARGETLAISGRTVPSIALRATGFAAHPRLHAEAVDDDARTWTAEGVLEATKKTLHDVSLELSRAGSVVHGRIQSLALGPQNDVQLGSVVLGGGDVGGTVRGDMRVVGGELDGQLEGDGIDLHAISKLLALPVPLRGTVDVDVDVRRTGNAARVGYAKVSVHDASALFVEGVDGTVTVDFEGTHVAPHAELRWRGATPAGNCTKGIFSAALGGYLDLDGPLVSADTWTTATGKLELEESTIDLDCAAPLVAALVPRERVPFGSLGGNVELRLVAERKRAGGEFALAHVSLVTSGLSISAPSDGAGKLAWQSDRLDARVDARADTSTGAVTLDATLLDATRRNAAASLATVHVEATLDPRWLSTPPTSAGLVLGLAMTPFSARVDAPELDERGRAALPSPWREALVPVGGTLSVAARAAGTALDPNAAIRARMRNLTAGGAAAEAGVPPVDIEVIGTYRKNTGRVSAWLELPVEGGTRRTIAELDAQLERPPLRLFGPPERARLAGTARLNGFPLGAIDALTRRDINGNLSGKVVLHDDGVHHQLAARIEGQGMRLGAVAFNEFRIDLGSRENGTTSEFEAKARLGAVGGGRLVLRGESSLHWRDGVPELDVNRPGTVSLEATAFPLRSLQPLLPKEITSVGGKLDGRASAAFRDLSGSDVILQAGLTVAGGSLHVPDYGQELSDIGALITARPGLISVNDIRAATPTGRLSGELDARLAGFRLIDFTGQFSVPNGEELPVALQGQAVGTVGGTIALRGERRDAEHLDIDLTAADLRLRLPASNTLRRTRLSPQPLAPHPDVVVRQPQSPPQALETKPGFVAVNVVLRNTTVEGSALRLTLSTAPDHPIRVAGPNDLSGELVFSSGFVKLMGKTFELDRGVVRLRSDEPSNPYVNMTAHWNAPDGTVVFVDYGGNVQPLTREKLHFRSNPPRSEDAILGLVLFGDTFDLTGSVATDAQRQASQAISGVLAAEMNQLFGDALPGLSAGIGAASEGYTSTTVSYQITDRFSAQAVVEQAPGTGPLGALGGTSGSTGSTTNAGVASGDTRARLGIDWRFADRWLMRGTVGVSSGAASGLEFLYQLRY